MAAIVEADLTAKQAEANLLLAEPQRHTELVGGGRSGKTTLLTRAVVMRAARYPESRHVIFRYRYNAVRRSIWLDTLPKVRKQFFPHLPFNTHEQDGYVELPNKSEIWISGLDDKDRVERILGMEFCTIYYNECSQIPFSSVVMGLTRLSQLVPGCRNRAYYDLNPVGKGHWTYRLFIEHKSPESLMRLPDPANYAHMFMNPVDNAANIDPEYIESLKSLPERARKRFLEGLYIDQYDGQLWTLDLLDANRVDIEDVPQMQRIVVAIDPSGASGMFDLKSDEIGIGVCGLGTDGHGYFLEDLSGLYSPEQWGRVACGAYHKWKADKVLGEKNFGGDMVRAIIHGADPNVAYEEVNASRGKVVRAEPIAALSETGDNKTGKIHNVGRFPQLEDELTNFTTAGYMGGRSPNRADAYVWGFTKLFPEAPSYGLFALWQQQAEALKAAQAAGKGKSKARVGSHVPQDEKPAPGILEGIAGLANAQKQGADFGRRLDVNKLAKTTGLAPQANVCPSCGNTAPSMFSEAWRCGACGASGPLVDGMIPVAEVKA